MFALWVLLLLFVSEIVAIPPSTLNNPIDLGHGYDSNSIAIVGFKPFRYTNHTTAHWGRKNGPWYTANDFASSEHSGTIIYTPAMHNKGATTIGNYHLSSLITEAIYIDVSEEVGNNWNYTFPASKLDKWVRANGEIPDNSVLIVNFGWSVRYPISSLYFGPKDNDLRYPGFSVGAVEWIIKCGKIIGVGFDTATPTPGSKVLASPYADLTFTNNNIYLLENMNIQERLPPKFNIIVLPMKLLESPAGPVRIIAY